MTRSYGKSALDYQFYIRLSLISVVYGNQGSNTQPAAGHLRTENPIQAVMEVA